MEHFLEQVEHFLEGEEGYSEQVECLLEQVECFLDGVERFFNALCFCRREVHLRDKNDRACCWNVPVLRGVVGAGREFVCGFHGQGEQPLSRRDIFKGCSVA